ncbi:hypothetical protein RHGRI_027469 [Rhododendron griersonianum]|uniref:Uncharacterized protein n=1 Tax=Rhododendron griersonianum TaxID=479676 RepID=A0AAV6J126_9ERIC|nr:hypothetical protein RHGRI_027469 [Rhododendron griersonianum]
MVTNDGFARGQLHQQQSTQSKNRNPPVDPLRIGSEPEVHLDPAGDRLLQGHRRKEYPGGGGGRLLALAHFSGLRFFAKSGSVADPDLGEAGLEGVWVGLGGGGIGVLGCGSGGSGRVGFGREEG